MVSAKKAVSAKKTTIKISETVTANAENQKPYLGEQYLSLRNQARSLYDNSDWSNEHIAAKLNISVRTFSRLRKFWGWPQRPPLNKRRALASIELIEPPGNAASLNARFICQLRRELETVEKMLTQTPDAVVPAAAAERRAKTIASLVRSFSDIRRLEIIKEGDTNADFPTTLEELRAELARRLDQLRDARGSGDSD